LAEETFQLLLSRSSVVDDAHLLATVVSSLDGLEGIHHVLAPVQSDAMDMGLNPIGSEKTPLHRKLIVDVMPNSSNHYPEVSINSLYPVIQ
jgi:hypothetical protein